MRISNLEAKFELHQIETAALTRAIASPLTSSQRRTEAINRRDAALVELNEIEAELAKMRRSFPRLDRTRRL